MFGGLGGEVYYRPFNSNFSSSIQFHRVQQRNFDQKFGFRDYKVNTGHLSFYYDFPKGIQSQFMFGKYLAGDKGVTVDLSRRFKNGFTLGVFATKTNLSSEEFVIKDGERIAQMVITKHEKMEWVEVENLDDSERGAGGFGSTGVK